MQSFALGRNLALRAQGGEDEPLDWPRLLYDTGELIKPTLSLAEKLLCPDVELISPAPKEEFQSRFHTLIEAKHADYNEARTTPTEHETIPRNEPNPTM